MVLLRDLLYDGRRKMDGKELLHKFWSQKHPILNDVKDYIKPVFRSKFLYEFMPKMEPSASILELGCNVGRNLNYLFTKGFRSLSDIEINKRAIEKRL